MNEIIVTSEDLFNIKQAAENLHITRQTIYRWIASGKIISIKLGGMPFIPKSEVDRLLRAEVAVEAVAANVASKGTNDAKSGR